ncbi:MAG TPA: GSU2403 family nucleotidyltransferase fold protein [Rhizomicrobium sp.]|jgi:hypothetical protein|nr:GSU2403 family nucleotidyltransferase fold protein [Rhizomicrobium sp.]
MSRFDPFSDEQTRALVNLEQRYRVWIEAERVLASLPYDLRRKDIDGRHYLYEIDDRGGNGRSLGPWSADNARKFEAYREAKTQAKARRDNYRATAAESARLARALRLPLLASPAGEILREADRRSLLGSHVLVVGTNAMAAYMAEAGGFLRDAPDETNDFDMAWSAIEGEQKEQTLWNLLKAVDPTYTVNTERPFQALNAKAYEVEILVAPSRAATMFQTDKPQPVPLPEQEWLLLGRTVDHVVPTRDGDAARIVAPDPRWFALHKLWMSRQPKRNPLKRRKDEAQGRALLDAVAKAMPQYPLDEAFVAELPAELGPHYAAWKAGAET